MVERVEPLLSDPLVGKLFSLLVAVLAILSIFSVVKKRFIFKIGDTGRRYKAKKAINFVSFTLCFLAALSVFSDSLGRLTFVLGAMGAGVAFSLQEVIASVAGWFTVTFGGYYRAGDRIQLGGIRGDVIDIGVLRTTLMECGDWVNGDLYNGRIVRVANSFVFKEPVYNYSADFEFLWDEIVVPIRLGTDISQVQKVLEEVAEEVVGGYSRRAEESWRHVVSKYNIEAAQVTPMITAHLLVDRINFVVRYVVEYKKRRTTQHQLTSKIVERLRAATPPIRTAASVVEIDRVGPLDVHLENKGPAPRPT